MLWTKPSEIAFFGPAGFALALMRPLGAQEHANRAWARRLGAALDAGDVRHAGAWLDHHLADGSLARVAYAAATRMPTTAPSASWRWHPPGDRSVPPFRV